MKNKYDFGGWVTKYNVHCTDGRTILPGAFKHCDGMEVPIVWNHAHNDPNCVLGYATLEHRDEGVFGYAHMNDTESGKTAKKLVMHGDVRSFSICANRLQQSGGDVLHGDIKEVSLVLAGANPGARIVDMLSHSDDGDEYALITPDERLELCHADEDGADNDEGEGETYGDVYDKMTDRQKLTVAAIVEQAVKDAKEEMNHNDDDEEESEMKHNVFDAGTQPDELTMSQADVDAIFADVRKSGHGSLKEECLAHGVTNLEYLFPDAQNVTRTPSFIKRKPDGWVNVVMNGVHHTPFSRIKSIHADITADEARARGYIKGKKKIEEVFTLLKRTTDPQTIYKLQKMDRDDVIDITDFEVVSWIKTEMRWMLDEEIARAILIGDGRLTSDDSHIKHDHIRPIFNDDSLYTIQYVMDYTADENAAASAFVDDVVLAMEDYDGSGNPTLFTTQRQLTRMLLLKDLNGHRLYKDVKELATAMLVKDIVVVPVMKNLKDDDGLDVRGIVVNLDDYNVGADKGGAVRLFDDFDIDYNKYAYLIETRISGAMTRPHSAICIKMAKSA